MKLTNYIMAILGLGLVTNATAGIKEYKKIVNGCRIVRIKSPGFFCPSTTDMRWYPTNAPGVLYPLTSASNPGMFSSAAGAAGTATSGGLIRPAKVEVNQGGGSLNGFIQGGDMNVTPAPAGGGGGFTPPGHQPGHGQPGHGND